MNDTQKKIIMGAVIIAALMLIIQPYQQVSPYTGHPYGSGYALVGASPEHGQTNIGALITQLSALAIAAFALVKCFGDKA